LVESELDPVHEQAEDLAPAGWLGLRYIFAQAPQVAHDGLHFGLHVHGPTSGLGGT